MNTGFNRAEIMRAAWNQARACHRQASTSHHYTEQARSPRIRLGLEPEAPFTRKISEFFAHGLRAAWEQAKRKAAFARLPTNRQTAIQNAVIELACAEAIENFRVAQPKIAAARQRLNEVRS